MSYASYTDEQLLSLLKMGDEAAFTELYNRYWKLLFSVASNKTGSLVDAEEMVQEVFADIWKRRKILKITHSVKSYLAAATKFQVYSCLSKKRKQQKILQGMVNPTVPTPEQELDFRTLHISIHKKISSLPEKCQLIYLLKQEGLSNKEVADTLNISIKTVESQTTTALRRLRTGLNYLCIFFFR